MKLLLDQHLSPRLATSLADLFPLSTHVSFVGLDCVTDEAVWNYARGNGYVIVTKDPDFADLSVAYGPPPKVIWLRLGNCTTQEIEAAIREHREEIEALVSDPTAAVLEVSHSAPMGD
jgi:predicted nuclease of predicted toxin-antitoxin system